MKKSLEPVITLASHILILGTMPGEQSLAQQQYYANPANQFWTILSAVYETSIGPLYSDRLAFLHENGLALWDVLDSCQRQGSLDSTITDDIPNNIHDLLEAYPRLRCIVLNGGKAKTLFRRYIWARLENGRNPNIQIIKLPSTSSTPGRYVKTLEEKIEAWSILRTYAR